MAGARAATRRRLPTPRQSLDRPSSKGGAGRLLPASSSRSGVRKTRLTLSSREPSTTHRGSHPAHSSTGRSLPALAGQSRPELRLDLVELPADVGRAARRLPSEAVGGLVLRVLPAGLVVRPGLEVPAPEFVFHRGVDRFSGRVSGGASDDGSDRPGPSWPRSARPRPPQRPRPWLRRRPIRSRSPRMRAGLLRDRVPVVGIRVDDGLLPVFHESLSLCWLPSFRIDSPALRRAGRQARRPRYQ